MEQRNEPTTDAIVRALRIKAKYGLELPDDKYAEAADRLESDGRAIADKDAKIVTLTEKVEALENDLINFDMNLTEMTARAEQTERERDTLISSIERLRTKKIELCSICEFEDLIACCHKNHCEGYQLFKRRGLPQDGEGK